MTQFIKKLPAVFQTTTEKKFFDSTFDQVFSKKDSNLLSGYIGRRTSGDYNPVTDFYLPEPTKDRTWWQLEATAFAQDASSNKTNIFFYEDLLERIRYYGGNTLNQDRLFESEYYSFGPPIDYDMFINYQNYYWVEQGLAVVSITGVTSSDIIGKLTFNTNEVPGATPANLQVTSGMSISLLSDPAYSSPHTVENIGECIGIRLVPQFPDFTEGTIFEFLPWDGNTQLSTGRIINNARWDGNTWDTQTQPLSGDYITIERGSLDRNAWSRTNKWFHISAISTTIAATGTSFPANSTRALRPIIQFVADLNLWQSGTQFRSDINYGFRNDVYGNPIRFLDYQGEQVTTVNSQLGTNLANGELLCFFNDDTLIGDPGSGTNLYNQYIFFVSILLDGTVDFTPYTSWATPILEGDIVFVTEDGLGSSAQRGQSWYYDLGTWLEVANDKAQVNQPPLFQLYDHSGVRLDDPTTYPNSSFAGNKIFSYKIDETPGVNVDPVLKFAIVYTALGQSSDIVFQNNLITDRYTYSTSILPIDGYYYYKTATDPVIYNNWNLYQPCTCGLVPPPPANCIDVSKQRVIDKFVVGYGTKYQFMLSAEPYGYPTSPDLIVLVNGQVVKNASEQLNGYTLTVINNKIYVDLVLYISSLLSTTQAQAQAPVVEIQTYTHEVLNPESIGYFEIPQQLEANPNQLEVSDISGSNLTEHFVSIIANQIGEEGVAFGGINNYRDTRKNRSVGTFILQNVSPALKTMLVSSSDDLDFIAAERFSQDEYTKFKNKYLRTALQLINQGFNPLQYHNNSIIVSAWVEEILKVVNVSNEFSNAFAYSYMIANGSPYSTQTTVVPIGSNLTLSNYLDLSDQRNSLYIYDISGHEELLVIGKDYEIVSTNLSIDVHFNPARVGNAIYIALYKNPLPAYIPSTPTKIGAYSAYMPRIEWDTSYVTPTFVIIGHDGSKTIAFGDYRDQLLLELEKRIYNLLQYKFRNQYQLPIRLESVKSGYFRKTRYSLKEYLDITESYINKWSAKNRANYRTNDWPTASTEPSVVPSFDPGIGNIWKLYNYSEAKDVLGNALHLPGNWKGIFQFFYDTYYPDTRPWEMLGFSEQPIWWVSEYGAGVTNLAGQAVWPSSPAYAAMWDDLTSGTIRQGPSAIFDPVTLLPQPQEMWARPGLLSIIPVTPSGEIVPVMTLFNIAFSGNYYEPFDHFDEDWAYGDGAPVEQAWMCTSGYAFSVQEFLYLMKPSSYGELCWDTIGTNISPGTLYIPGTNNPVISNTNWQFVQNSVYTSGDPYFAWMRPKNKNQIVHAETIDNVIQIRYGYQRWVSDRLLFLGKDIASTFGQKVRTLDVNLANKFAGFTNKDTTNLYIESVSPNATTNSLIIPSTNFGVVLHKSPVVETYSYSGVIIRALSDGTFAVYGYDLLRSEFIVLDRSDSKLIEISVGGTPSPFLYFTSGATYKQGDIVRYNGVYYVSLVTQTVQKFISSAYKKLKSLPVQDSISVTYKPNSEKTLTKVPYGTILKTPQDVFDLLIGWGAYLEKQGWNFQDVNQDTNIVNDWLSSAKQFLFWLNTNWAPDASIQLSPSANKLTLKVSRGYPNDVEALSNGVYSILDKFGVAIPPTNTTVDRDGQTIIVEPITLGTGGIYYLQVNTSETEHVIIVDNLTSFNDTVYSPLLRARQQRLRLNGFRSNAWYGKMEAPGYLIIDNQLVPNFDTIVDSMRSYYDPNVVIDNPSLEDLGRHLIGYESKSYLDNLQVANNTQYLFYQGAIRQKGTSQAFDKLFRSTKVQSNEIIEVYEEWALKVGSFGNTIEQVSTEFILKPEKNTGEVIVAKLNYIPSRIGFVKQIDILNAENKYTSVPKVIIYPPDANPLDLELTGPIRQARAYVILDSIGRISRIDITDPGYGYLSAPYVEIDSGAESHSLDKLYSVWQGQIIKDTSLDNVVNIDIDQTDLWTVRPIDPAYSLEFPTTPQINYSLPNAGYVNFNDVTWSSFDVTQTAVNWGTPKLNPKNQDTVWVAKNFTEDWNVYKVAKFNKNWLVTKDNNNDLILLTDLPEDASLTVIPQSAGAATAKLDNGYIATIDVLIGGSQYVSAPTVHITDASGTGAIATAVIENGTVTSIVVTNGGHGYVLPTITIDAPPSSGITAVGSANVLYQVAVNTVSAGGFYSTAPLVTFIGEASSIAKATSTISSGSLTGINITAAGGYSVLPTISLSSPDFVIPATLIPVVNTSGSITSVTIANPGKGYTTGARIVANRAVDYIPLYVDAVITVTSVGSHGEILSVHISNGGTGYQSTYPNAIIPQLWNSVIGDRTDFGNMIVLQQVINGAPVGENNYTVGIMPYTTTDYVNPGTYTDPDTLVTYNAYYLTTLTGVPITATEIGNYADFNELLLFKSMRWYDTPVEPVLPTYVGLGDLIWVDNVDNKWVVFEIQADPGIWDISNWNPLIVNHWSPNYGWDVTGPLYFNPYRVQEALINTSLFENAGVYSTNTKDELVQLPIYDPFKDILPGPARQNITFMSLQDPATYNVTPDITLFDENITFSEKQVGQLWWDLSSTRYVYYEQPLAVSETENDNLIYRRDNWGKLFPGSTVSIYEWVKSPVPPAIYTGTGTPRDITTYVQISTSNKFTGATEINYYFWVLNTTDKPNIENRTMAATDVASMLQSPKSQGFVFFSPIQQTVTNNAYMFYNIQEILAYRGNNVQIQYRLAERNDQKHTQWAFFREGDTGSIVTDQFWNKLVDSICGYTKLLPVSDNFNGIIIAKDLPWDVYGWDITAYDSATINTTPEYGEILPVPDPTLSEGEKYGIEYRPRQSMFVALKSARKVFVQSANNLLKHIPIRDNNPDWNAGVTTSDYWAYTNWYEVGFEDITPNIVYQTLSQANIALITGNLQVGNIVEVSNGTVDGRFILYEVVQLNPNVATLSLNEVGIENSAIKLLDTVYTVSNIYALSTELRELMNAFRTQVMINAYLVDQNELFFSMINYVLSEQKAPNWVFKSSYIYIKENNLPLNQTQLYIPDQISNITQFITDSKPYHTQIRDYTSTYITQDIAAGSAIDSTSWNIKVEFGPEDTGNTPIVPRRLDAQLFTDNIQQFVSQENVYTIPLTFYDVSKKGYSHLYPYTFSVDTIFTNPAQTFITPSDIVGIQIDTTVLLYGVDYYVEFNNDNTPSSDGTYTVYFYNDPAIGISPPTPVAIVWFDGGEILTTYENTYRRELAIGYATQDLVINVYDKLPINFDGTTYSAISDMWDFRDNVIEGIVQDLGGMQIGFGNSFWDQDTTSNIVILDNTIGYTENYNNDDGEVFYRKCYTGSGTLAVDLLSPDSTNQYTQSMVVYVDPATHSGDTDIFPSPSIGRQAIWIGGERIEYGQKLEYIDPNTHTVVPNTWELKLLLRGTHETSAVTHTTTVVDPNNPTSTIPNIIWIELANSLQSSANVDIWNAVDPTPQTHDDNSYVTSVPLGGLWYAQTAEAKFLKECQSQAPAPASSGPPMS